jgi:hypothetical protein
MPGCFRCTSGEIHGWLIEAEAPEPVDPPAVNTDRQSAPYGKAAAAAATFGNRSPYVEVEEEETASKKEWAFQPVIEAGPPERSEVEVPEYDVEEAVWELLDLS